MMILLFVLVLLVLDGLAMAFGADSRDGRDWQESGNPN